MRVFNSGLIRKMYLDKQGNPWELVQKYHTDNYTYCVVKNVITDEQTTLTDWQVQKHLFEVPTR